MTTIGRLLQVAVCALPLSVAPGLRAETPKPSEPKVKVTATSKSWVVVRKANDEKQARLTYSYSGRSPKRVEGSRDGSNWKFRIDEDVPPNVSVTLEFELFRTSNKAEAGAALIGAAGAIADELTRAFPDAAASATSGDTVNIPLLYASLGALTREKIASILKAAKLGDYELDGKPAPQVLLEGLGFKQLGPTVWEPTSRTFGLLSAKWGRSARRLWSLTSIIAGQSPSVAPCAGNLQTLQAGGTTARRTAAVACLKAFAVNAGEALKGAKNAKGEPLWTPQLAQHATKLSTESSPPANVFTTATTFSEGNGEVVFAEEVAASMHALNGALAVPEGVRHADAAKFKRDTDAAGKAYSSAQLAAALELEPAVRATVAAELRSDIEKAVITTFQTALVAERLTTQDYASEVFVADKPKPRFFISTGVMAAAFNDDWQLALPVIASICVTAAGCETKGAGSGGNQGNYFSFDLGVKTVRLGGDDRREGAPSLLVGFGATPFYATHFSLGLNVFPNRQSDTPRANAALYLAVTLDTIDGADILGSLGVGKPEVKPIGETSP